MQKMSNGLARTERKESEKVCVSPMQKKTRMNRKCYVRPECLMLWLEDAAAPLAASPPDHYIPIATDEEGVPSTDGE